MAKKDLTKIIFFYEIYNKKMHKFHFHIAFKPQTQHVKSILDNNFRIIQKVFIIIIQVPQVPNLLILIDIFQ